MAERNLGVDEDQRITFRVGFNLEDIIIDGEDIHGDGVNIAARLQEIAMPGGIAISHHGYEDIRARPDATFQGAGEQMPKNIVLSVKVWQWSSTATSTGIVAGRGETLPLPDKPSIVVLPFENMSGDPDQE